MRPRADRAGAAPSVAARASGRRRAVSPARANARAAHWRCGRALRRDGFARARVGARVRAGARGRRRSARHAPLRRAAHRRLGDAQGMLAEMATGEGKTLTARCRGAPRRWPGMPVHVITVNDYLAQRDAEAMRPGVRGARPDASAAWCTAMAPRERRRPMPATSPTAPTRSWPSTTCATALVLGGRPRPLATAIDALAGARRARGQLLLRGLHSPSSTRPTAC